MSDAPELLPCPFCGGSAKLNHYGVAHSPWARTVGCNECNGIVSMRSVTEAEVVAAWNRRATPAALAASPEVQAMIREAEARLVDRACLAISERAEWPEDEHGRTEQPELFARVIHAIRADAAALRGEKETT